MTKNTASIIGAGAKENRQESDFYPTPSDVTIALLEFLDLPKDKVIWEPACGDGAMSRIFTRYGYQTYSTDIRDTDYSILQHDFLSIDIPYKPDAIITNPPFNQAKKFIIHALKIAPVVAMVLKSQYWHAAERHSLFTKHPPAWVMPLTWRPDFLKGGAPQMDILWTVWQQDDVVTKYKPLAKPKFQHQLF